MKPETKKKIADTFKVLAVCAMGLYVIYEFVHGIGGNMQTPEIMIGEEVVVFEYNYFPGEKETGFLESLEIENVKILSIFENMIELNDNEQKWFLEKYGEDKIKEMILAGSTVYK